MVKCVSVRTFPKLPTLRLVAISIRSGFFRQIRRQGKVPPAAASGAGRGLPPPAAPGPDGRQRQGGCTALCAALKGLNSSGQLDTVRVIRPRRPPARPVHADEQSPGHGRRGPPVVRANRLPPAPAPSPPVRGPPAGLRHSAPAIPPRKAYPGKELRPRGEPVRGPREQGGAGVIPGRFTKRPHPPRLGCCTKCGVGTGIAEGRMASAYPRLGARVVPVSRLASRERWITMGTKD